MIADGGNLLQALAATDVSKDVSADDRAIRERLTAKLKAQPWASMLTKNIVVENGVVHLFGFGRNEGAAPYASAAENVPGVVRVEDRMMRRQATVGE